MSREHNKARQRNRQPVARRLKPQGYRVLLRANGDAKTIKGSKFGYETWIMYLAPADSSGVINVCIWATEGPTGCKEPCLNSSGKGGMKSVQRARIRKTIFYVEQQELFMECLRYDIHRAIRRAKRLGVIPCIRINGTSDIPKIAMQLAREFPDVTFYDYTKAPQPWLRVTANYHLTFSFSGENLPECMEALEHGINVAVVFKVKRGAPLPETWNGYRVIDGDVSDLRFLDPKGVIVGLRAKGKARKAPCGGFVQTPQFVQIQIAA